MKDQKRQKKERDTRRNGCIWKAIAYSKDKWVVLISWHWYWQFCVRKIQWLCCDRHWRRHWRYLSQIACDALPDDLMLVDILTVLDNTQLVSNLQLLYGREWARSYSNIWQEILHSRLNAEIIIGQVPGCAVACYYPCHASTCQLRLVCSRTKGRKDLSNVGLSAEFCNLLDLSATFNLSKNWLSGVCLMKNRTTWWILAAIHFWRHWLPLGL